MSNVELRSCKTKFSDQKVCCLDPVFVDFQKDSPNPADRMFSPDEKMCIEIRSKHYQSLFGFMKAYYMAVMPFLLNVAKMYKNLG